MRLMEVEFGRGHVEGKSNYRAFLRVRLFRFSLALCLGLFLACLAFVPSRSGNVVRALGCLQGSTLNIVAHQDDDLLFLNADTLHSIQAGRCVRTIFLTAGDAGAGSDYWLAREAGSKAAYAQMSGVANSWVQTDAGVLGHPIPVFTLAGKPTVSLVFMRLPDGNLDGSGFAATGHESLQKLQTGTISTLHAIDGSSSYTKSGLTTTLSTLMLTFLPDQIRTQDFAGSYGDGDHSDHHATAYFARAAQLLYVVPHTFTGYQDYATAGLPQNVTGADLAVKQNAFFAYAHYDLSVCGSTEACANTIYDLWLRRQYTLGAGSSNGNPLLSANAGLNQVVAAGSTVRLDGTESLGDALLYHWVQTGGPPVVLSGSTTAQPTFLAPDTSAILLFQLVVNNGQVSSNPATVEVVVGTVSNANLAPASTATASSENASFGQTAAKAIDGVIDGYPGDFTKEWATNGGRTGSWLKLTWTTPQVVSRVVLYDRPNVDDWITGGTLQFSDGSSIPLASLQNDGSALVVNFSGRVTTSLLFTVTSVSSSSQNVGLAEIQVYSNNSDS